MRKKKKGDRTKINYSDLGNIDPETYRKWKEQLRDGSYELPKTRKERFDEWIAFAPAPVVAICKILKFILDVGGFIFMIVGGVVMLVSAWKILQAIDASGWRGLLDWNTAYIVGYFVVMFIINKISFLMFRIIEGR